MTKGKDPKRETDELLPPDVPGVMWIVRRAKPPNRADVGPGNSKRDYRPPPRPN